MNSKINRIQWKCRRGMREIDLLLREFTSKSLNSLDEKEFLILDEVLNYDDQKLYDYIFKNVSLGNTVHENFVAKYLKTFSKQGNF
ncbi:MAG: succinate dehydrogenase assembly factor 2 [Gammaproteobacteria bacterium]|jgi:antitoxin CptB|nr:MAG: succinate dehydrogenase assembly factor 2 [Gammaproteobacteria bacterium TMED225]|tara:strand:- start:165 stop:422 length:258 start_codon:yes stop_codon:yes gene_type:complete